jgi:hypothetical protein
VTGIPAIHAIRIEFLGNVPHVIGDSDRSESHCAGDGRIPSIHPDDIADIATRALPMGNYARPVSLRIIGPSGMRSAREEYS